MSTVTSQRAAELVSAEGLPFQREVVAGVERIVSEELEQIAVKGVGARPGYDIDDRARDVAVLRPERRAVDLELLDASDRLAILQHG